MERKFEKYIESELDAMVAGLVDEFGISQRKAEDIIIEFMKN
jgi:hypothetical protein